jgi:hypothetical protein
MQLISKPLLVNADAADSVGVADLRRLGTGFTTHYVKWGTGVSSGVVSIESADKPDYDGEWALLDTVTFEGTAPKQDIKRIDGSFSAIRHRVSTIVTDGTVSTKISGSE